LCVENAVFFANKKHFQTLAQLSHNLSTTMTNIFKVGVMCSSLFPTGGDTAQKIKSLMAHFAVTKDVIALVLDNFPLQLKGKNEKSEITFNHQKLTKLDLVSSMYCYKRHQVLVAQGQAHPQAPPKNPSKNESCKAWIKELLLLVVELKSHIHLAIVEEEKVSPGAIIPELCVAVIPRLVLNRLLSY